MNELEKFIEFWKFRSIVAENPRGCTNYKGSAKFEDIAEVQIGIQMVNEQEEVFEFWKFHSIVAEDPRGCTNYKGSAKFEDIAEV